MGIFFGKGNENKNIDNSNDEIPQILDNENLNLICPECLEPIENILQLYSDEENIKFYCEKHKINIINSQVLLNK